MKENEIQKTQMKQEISVQRELEQAETAGEKALWSLYIARDTLNSAKKWGMVDLLAEVLSQILSNIRKWIRQNPSLFRQRKIWKPLKKN